MPAASSLSNLNFRAFSLYPTGAACPLCGVGPMFTTASIFPLAPMYFEMEGFK